MCVCLYCGFMCFLNEGCVLKFMNCGVILGFGVDLSIFPYSKFVLVFVCFWIYLGRIFEDLSLMMQWYNRSHEPPWINCPECKIDSHLQAARIVELYYTFAFRICRCAMLSISYCVIKMDKYILIFGLYLAEGKQYFSRINRNKSIYTTH